MEHSPKQPNAETKKVVRKKKKKKRSFLQSLFRFLWILFFLGLFSVIGLFVCITKGWGPFDDLPTSQVLENPKNSLASEVYSIDGILLGKFYIQDRSNVEFDNIPQHLIDALVATEDCRFFEHCGIDFYGLTTAIYRTLKGSPSGASTISQQLAKNLLHERSSSKFERIIQKLQEWVIAVGLERNYTKNEILKMYFNTVHLSADIYGIKSAAKTFFNVEPADLTVEQGAVLVGMLKGSTKFNPKRNPELSKNRRNIVLDQMGKYDYLSKSALDSIQELDLELDYLKLDHNEGLATYFREQVKKDIKIWAEKNQKVDGSKYDIYTDGLKIYTTIHSKLQQYAEEAALHHMEKLQKDFDEHWDKKDPWHDDDKFMERAIRQSERYRVLKEQDKSQEEIDESFDQPTEMRIFSYKGDIDTVMTPLDSIKYYKRLLRTAFMAVNPETGHVLAWVGGVNHRHFKYDGVTATNQVGSTFKPFVYTLAIQNGWSPCQKLKNMPITFHAGEFGIPKAWRPRGSTKMDGQLVSLQRALANSLNWITARLLKEVGGPNPVVDLTKEMGIVSFLDPVPAICLGVPDISLKEMVGAYTSFANQGVNVKPMYITRIDDKNDHTLQRFAPEEKEVLSEQTAYVMLKLMQGVTSYGTGTRLRSKYGIKGQVAGKTGTTNNNSDGWFMGVVPNLVGGVWTGGDEKVIHFRSTRLGQGANMALPIWAEFMKKVHADESLGISPDDKFERPSRINITTDCSKYDTPNSDTFEDSDDPFNEMQDERFEDEFDN